MAVNAHAVRGNFLQGSEVVIPFNNECVQQISEALTVVGDYLSTTPIEDTFRLEDGLDLTRQTLWVAAKGIGLNSSYVEDEAAMRNIDGNFNDGKKGLAALAVTEVRESIGLLKRCIDEPLIGVLGAVGVRPDDIANCVVRYRTARYKGGLKDSGIGAHTDDNFVTGLITDRPGLLVLKADGSTREPSRNGVITMAGTALTKWSEGKYVAPRHLVQVREDDPVKTSFFGLVYMPEHVPPVYVVKNPVS